MPTKRDYLRFTPIFENQHPRTLPAPPPLAARRCRRAPRHSGNALVLVSDKHLSQDVDANNKVDFYFADVISAKDYWPFGSVIVERLFTSSGAGDYRYGFNGKEDDDEWGVQDYGARIYNPQVARFLSVDPLTGGYPELTPYQFASNTPIWARDLDGLEAQYSNDGAFLGYGPDRTPNAEVHVRHTYIQRVGFSYRVATEWEVLQVQEANGVMRNLTHHEFLQVGAYSYNETYTGTYETDLDKFRIAETIVHYHYRHTWGKSGDASFQHSIDQLATVPNDSHERRMLNDRGGVAAVESKKYAEYYSSSQTGSHTGGREMRMSTLAAINAFSKYGNTHNVTLDGWHASNWGGEGGGKKVNTYYGWGYKDHGERTPFIQEDQFLYHTIRPAQKPNEW
jgi:RHS repeat-associated protein